MAPPLRRSTRAAAAAAAAKPVVVDVSDSSSSSDSDESMAVDIEGTSTAPASPAVRAANDGEDDDLSSSSDDSDFLASAPPRLPPRLARLAASAAAAKKQASGLAGAIAESAAAPAGRVTRSRARTPGLASIAAAAAPAPVVDDADSDSGASDEEDELIAPPPPPKRQPARRTATAAAPKTAVAAAPAKRAARAPVPAPPPPAKRARKTETQTAVIVSDSDGEFLSDAADEASDSDSDAFDPAHHDSEDEPVAKTVANRKKPAASASRSASPSRAASSSTTPATMVPGDAGEPDIPVRTKKTYADYKAERLADAQNPDLVGLTAAEKRAYKAERKTIANHPELATAWEDIRVLDPPPVMDQPADLKLKLLPYQLEGLGWLTRQETEYGGGLLADEMGMGKTISMISLMLTNRKTPTLIIAPTVAVKQWEQEIAAHVKDEAKFSVLLFHGQKRVNEEAELRKYDIIITSYALLESAFRKQEYGHKRTKDGQKYTYKEPSALHSIHWERIILDESHSIKERSTNTARASFALKSNLKWALSGTPIQNRVGEMYSVIRFLGLDPFAHYYCRECPCKSLTWRFQGGRICKECGHTPQQHFCFWNAEILKPIQNYGAQEAGLAAFDKFKKLLDMMMLRRTKLERADDLGLPPRHVHVRRDYFNEEERDFYASLYSDTQRQFATYVAAGTVLNNYANIFELLTRMRQAANHPCMVTSKLRGPNGELLTPASAAAAVCGLCHEEAEDPVTSKCNHTFCREDIRQYVDGYVGADAGLQCPTCFSKLVIDLDAEAAEVTAKARTSRAAANSIVGKLDMANWRSSTKIEALVEELTNLRRQDHTIKSIVFSQFVSFLDLIHWRLRRAGFKCVKLDGRMTVEQRDAVIRAFMTDTHVTVFLVSLKAGGVALNLTEASQVFLMDPWWNGSVSDQAVDRIHRLGQYRPIRITHIIIEDSIEDRILELQRKKKALIDSTVGKDTNALARLSEDDFRFLFSL
ncbi:DNA repair protein rad16 [Blastocladiella emersonii ATCC 22665]|nr:DNA repair protein rad16 [Blastocladiella emersonii ATCC 22665]